MRTIVDNKKKCDNSGLNATTIWEACRIQRFYCVSRSLYLYVYCLVLLTYELRFYELHVAALQYVEYLAYSRVTDYYRYFTQTQKFSVLFYIPTYTTRILIAHALFVTKGQETWNRKIPLYNGTFIYSCLEGTGCGPG